MDLSELLDISKIFDGIPYPLVHIRLSNGLLVPFSRTWQGFQQFRCLMQSIPRGFWSFKTETHTQVKKKRKEWTEIFNNYLIWKFNAASLPCIGFEYQRPCESRFKSDNCHQNFDGQAVDGRGIGATGTWKLIGHVCTIIYFYVVYILHLYIFIYSN